MPSQNIDNISHRAYVEKQWWTYGEFSQTVTVDVSLLKKRMLKFLSDPSLCIKMGNEGFKRVKQKFTWVQVIHKYEQEWKRLIDKANSSNFSETSSPIWYNHLDIFKTHPTIFFTSEIKIKGTGKYFHELLPINHPPSFLSSKILKKILKNIDEPILIKDISIKTPDLDRYIAYLLKQGFVEIIDE